MIMKFFEDNIVIIFIFINFQFYMFDYFDRFKELFYFLYDVDFIQFDFIFQDIDIGNYFSVRWGLEIVFLGIDKKTVGMYIEIKKFIDDEYIFGVFEVFRFICNSIIIVQF